MSGFSKPPAADGAPWIGPEQSQQNTQSGKKPQSLRERLRHKGRHYLNKAPGFLHPQNKQLPLARWMSNSTKVKTDVDPQPLSAASHQFILPRPAISSVGLRTMDTKTEFQGLFSFPPQQEPLRASSLEPVVAANNIPQPDAEISVVKPAHRRWLKGYTTSRKRVNSVPTYSLELGDLTGVGSQYDATNRPTSMLPISTDHSDLVRYPQLQQQFSGNRLSQPTIPTWKTHISELEGQIPFPEQSPYEIDLHRRLSNDTAQGYSTTAESIFTRPSSTISAASTWESSIGRVSSSPSQRRSLFRRTLSSSSSLHISQAPYNSIGGHTVPPIPTLSLEMRKRLSLPYHMPAHQQLPSTSAPPDLITARVARQDCSLTVSDQVALTGWVAQQRRVNKSPLANQMQEESGFDVCETSAPVCDIELPSGGDPDPELTTIEERLSETGLSNEDNVSTGGACSGDHAPSGSTSVHHHLSPRRKSHSVGTSTTTDIRSATTSNRDLMYQADTPASSVSDIGEEVEDDTSEADESISNVSRETDESLEEAFHASSLDPGLFDTVTALKDRITTLVMERVSEWVTTCATGQGSGKGPTGTADDSGAQKPAGQDSNGKKRGLNDDDEDEHASQAGRGNGDDQDKRRKTETPAARALPKLACPFVKEYPGEKWRCCQKGWHSVHRIKEHIYRSHRAPIHCKRCFSIVKTEKQLELHLRQDKACEVLHPPREMPGIDAETKELLKSRQGIQHNSEEERWTRMYKILFPLAQQVPSPYCDLQTFEAPMTAEGRAQYRSFLRREIPVRVIRDINNNMMTEPQFTTELSERRLFEMISSAVWNAFDAVLPSLLPQIEPPDIPAEDATVLEIAADSQHPTIPAASVTPADLPDTPQELSNVLETVLSNQDTASFNAYNSDPIAELEMLNPAHLAATGLEPAPDGFGSINDDFDFDFSFDFLTQRE